MLAAERWCRDGGELAVRSLRVGSLPAVPVLPGDDVSVLLSDAVASTTVTTFELASVTHEGFRSVVAAPLVGRVSLLEGGARIETGRWLSALDGFTALPADASELVVYGFVKRGSNRALAVLGQSLDQDWPRPPYRRARTAEAFEDAYAPDAFGMQLLGPGYAGRVLRGERWKAARLAGDRLLLEHTEPSAWFETSFAPFGGIRYRSPDAEPPAVLTAARADFATIMFPRRPRRPPVSAWDIVGRCARAAGARGGAGVRPRPRAAQRGHPDGGAFSSFWRDPSRRSPTPLSLRLELLAERAGLAREESTTRTEVDASSPTAWSGNKR